MEIGDKIVQGREGKIDLAVEYTIVSAVLGCSCALTTPKQPYQQSSLENAVLPSKPTTDYKIVKVDLVTFLKAATSGDNKNAEQPIHLISSLREEYDSTSYTSYMGSSNINHSYSAADIALNPFVVAAAGVLILKGIRSLFMPASWDTAISRAVSYPIRFIGNLYR
ncbi:hypothetical protein HY636_01890 [Candidatus Woesearchaeota archaeon]|nr:hypothetical protein [Candidatus Woesearchaeota archaeon]